MSKNLTETEPFTMEICADCLILEANGEIPESRPDLLADIATHTGDLEVTLGRMRTEDVVSQIHLQSVLSCPLGRHNSALDDFWDFWAECDCEDWDDAGFSMSSCDMCGSHLGGDRYYATVWIPTNEEMTT